MIRRVATGVAALLLVCARIAPAQRFAELEAAVNDGIRLGAYPGAVVVVGRGDTVIYAKGFGGYTWGAGSRVPDPGSSLWDLASMSKIVATTSAIAVLVDQRRLDLDAPVAHYLPRFKGGGKGNVTVRMLLDHTSGLPAYTQLWPGSKSPADAVNKLYAVPLQRTPGLTTKYSDLNAMFAGMVIESISGKRLDVFADSAVFKPLGMRATMYNPTRGDRTRVVPTGRYRGTPVAGEVNDQNAKILGGVSGHAGLFSTGLDLARFAQTWLRNTTSAAAPWVAAATMKSFLQHAPGKGSRALGWDIPEIAPNGKPSLYGRCATPATVGHTGWTGTEIWLDPSENLFVIFLTNRSYDPRGAEHSFPDLKAIRTRVSDAARRAVGTCRG